MLKDLIPNSKTGWLDFLELCLKMGIPDELSDFFDLTFKEREVLAARYMILKALLKERLYRF